MNTPSKKLTDLTVPVVATIAAIFSLGLLAPVSSYAQADKQKSRQNDKNLMRNLAIGAGAAALYQGVKGQTTSALVLGAGAALAGKKYEDARKAQTRDNDSPRYGYDYPGNDSYRNDRDRNDSYRDDQNRNDAYREDNMRYNRPHSYNKDGRDPRNTRYDAPRGRQNNGKHKGWSKNGNDCD